LKQGVRYNTKVGYGFVLNLVKKEKFGNRKIRDIKVSDAKLWFIKMYNDGRGYSTAISTAKISIHIEYCHQKQYQHEPHSPHEVPL